MKGHTNVEYHKSTRTLSLGSSKCALALPECYHPPLILLYAACLVRLLCQTQIDFTD
jgi:hypothetical protein